MDEFISRGAAIAAAFCADAMGNTAYRDVHDTASRLRLIPAADARLVVRGSWEPSEKYKGYVYCSICHDCYVEPEWVTKLKWNYCPNCGADMREEQT